MMADDAAAGILARLEAILGRVPKTTDDDEHGGPEKPVPYAKFFAANQRAKAAEEGLTAIRADIAKLQQGYSDDLKAIQAAAAADVGRMAQIAAEDMELKDLNLDADGRSEARRVYGRLPEATRPKTVVEFWSGTVAAAKAAKADPKLTAPEVPRTLAAYLPVEQDQAQQQGQQQQGQQKRVSADRDVKTGQKSTAAEKLGKAKTWGELMAAAEEADASR